MAKQKQHNTEGAWFRRAGRWFRGHKIAAVLCGIIACIVIAIASAQIVHQLTREEPVTGQPFTTNSVTSKDGTKIGYRQYGKGTGIVLVHGGMMAAQDFNDLASVLSDEFTVYVPDRRGRGMSGPYTKDHSMQKEVEDMQALLDKTGAHGVFGLSAGAIIALESALQLPHIEKLAIYEPPIPLDGQKSTVGWLPEYDKELAEDNLGAALVTASKGTGDSSFITKLPRFIGVPFMNFAIKAQAQEAKPGEVPLKQLVPTLYYDARVVEQTKNKIKPFAALQTRVFLMNGTKSPDNLQAPIKALANVLPNAEHVEFAGAGHLAATNGEKPRAIAKELAAFFN
jgi:pimeloyl-ACP methyl ester carboxylesterase